jgi:hypothetical protein
LDRIKPHPDGNRWKTRRNVVATGQIRTNFFAATPECRSGSRCRTHAAGIQVEAGGTIPDLTGGQSASPGEAFWDSLAPGPTRSALHVRIRLPSRWAGPARVAKTRSNGSEMAPGGTWVASGGNVGPSQKVPPSSSLEQPLSRCHQMGAGGTAHCLAAHEQSASRWRQVASSSDLTGGQLPSQGEAFWRLFGAKARRQRLRR